MGSQTYYTSSHTLSIAFYKEKFKMQEISTAVESIVRNIKTFKEYDEHIYHNAHLLLHIYSDVVWQAKENFDDLEMECLRAYNQSVFSALDVLSDFTPDCEIEYFSNQMNSMEITKAMVNIINDALLKVKLYPRKGELYFDIINKCYLVKYKYSENELLDSLQISRTSFYRHKKSAVNLFGVTLWGFILPSLKKRFNGGTKLEPN